MEVKMKKLLLSLLILFLVIAVAACTGGQNKATAPGASQQTADKDAVANLVKDFGSKLKQVSLLAPSDVVSKSMQEHYGGLVSPELLAAWQKAPQNAPGRMVSSPWPERIEILNIVKLAEDTYEVRGNIIEVTSASQVGEDIAAKKPITLTVKKAPTGWLIDAVTMDSYSEDGSIIYSNSQYGFTFTLPESWKNYWIVTEQWEGIGLTAEQNGQVVEKGPIIKIRHPQWSESEPRQDIPIMIFTTDQWKALQEQKFSVGAAPVPPSELGRNDNYVFALPARYNYGFPTGYEEVEQILKGQPLQPN